MKSIVLITTGQPSGNPRVVKEADALQAAGYQVYLLYCFFIRWAYEKDDVLLQKVAWKYKLVGGSPYQNKKQYIFTLLRYKLARILNRQIGPPGLMAERAQARAYDELLREAKKIKADWYIGHNLGALAVAVKAARYHSAKAGFDFEDYHRGEVGAGEARILQRIIYLEKKYLPSLKYYSTASDLITITSQKNHPGLTCSVLTLNNCFPLLQQPAFKDKMPGDDTLQLFWFSQTIGINRGLEVVINALNILKDIKIHLTLAGRCNDDMMTFIKSGSGEMFSNIHFAGIVDPGYLPAFASAFDVGMAVELSVPQNRDLCLTNKIFTYLLAGNAVIISETSMQSAFNKLYNVGESFATNDEKALAQKIRNYQDKEILNSQRHHNYNLAKTELNWEKESEKLLLLLQEFN